MEPTVLLVISTIPFKGLSNVEQISAQNQIGKGEFLKKTQMTGMVIQIIVSWYYTTS